MRGFAGHSSRIAGRLCYRLCAFAAKLSHEKYISRKAQRQGEIRKEEGGQQAPFNLTTGSPHRQDQSQCFIGH
jgi:hypothetical protein